MNWINLVDRRNSGGLSSVAASLMLAAVTVSGPSKADQSASAQTGVLTGQRIAVPGTSFQFSADSVRRLLEHRDDKDMFLGALASWISNISGLPRVQTVPRVKFSPPETISALQSNEFAGWAPNAGQQTVVAVYDSITATIHLPDDWTGQTAGELSILVHEIVHHLQYANELKYECPQAREGAAYNIQQKWLALFGRDIERDFGVDPFTLLVRTKCFY